MKHFNFLSNFRWFTTVILLITLNIGQMWAVELFSLTSYTDCPSGWTCNGIEYPGGGIPYFKFNEAGDYMISPLYDPHDDVNFSYSITSFGSGTHHSLTIYILDKDDKILDTKSTNTTTTSYAPGNIDFGDIDSQFKIKIYLSATGRGVRLRVPTCTGTPLTKVTASPTSITFDDDELDGSGEASGSTTLDLSVSNGYKSSGNYLYLYVVSDDTECEFTVNSGAYDYSSGNSTSIDDLSVEYYAIDAGTWTGRIIASGYNSSYVAVNCTIPLSVTITASCSENPSIGNASLNGSISLSSFPVQTTGWTVGDNCAWSDFGFVWSTSVSTPTLESNGTASTNCTKIQKATSGTSTSTTHSITGSFSAGTTYYVRGYGKNGYASGTYQYTSVLTITPRSITFNSNGGSSVSTIYVNSGTAASAPTAPTKTGYNFGGWYTDNGTFASAVNWSSTISENKTYYAKWSAKQCTISFDIEGGTGTITNVTATYGQAMPSKESNLPTKTGYNFGGFWDGDGGTGTQYYNADGTSKINWNKDVTATQTLYAKWTIKNYTVTWKVNGEDYTAGTPTDNVNHGSHVTTLPTAPNTASYCGDKFMGWTDATDGAYVHGTSNLYTKASDFPNATGNQVFYAVFADYVAP